ncbi:MAG: type II toxin-antitoxin system HicA family toxin [Bacteroidota bacterium]
MAKHLKNISTALFRKYLEHKGLKHIRTSSGHEIWCRSDLKRPVAFQTHINPIPEFIIKNNLRIIGVDRDDFLDFLENG